MLWVIKDIDWSIDILECVSGYTLQRTLQWVMPYLEMINTKFDKL